jgi:tetratricopeptide (TPR) repeat protein
MRRSVVRTFALAGLTAVLLTTTGCASSIAAWIVQTRNHQGDVALVHQNDADASVAYQLALRIDPNNEHARTGLVVVQARIAQKLFALSRFDDAVAALAVANKYAPGDERIEALRAQIEQAEIKRDIVVSNYPAYKEAGASLRRSLVQIREQTAQITTALRRFDYTYDSSELSLAIRQSYELADELARITNRMVQYRQLVDSGIPESGSNGAVAPPASLLPLP